jgi:hypothetical protein
VFGLLSKYTFLSSSEFGDFNTATFFRPKYNPTAGKKKKSLEIFSPLFETYSIKFISSPLSHSSISFFCKKFLTPPTPFLVHPSSWPIPVAKN